jgi:hypothetical protein
MVIDPKKAAAMILSRGEKPKAPPEEPKIDDRDVGLEAACEALIKAFESKNVKGMVSAMRSFNAQCGSLPESEPDTEPAPEASEE